MGEISLPQFSSATVQKVCDIICTRLNVCIFFSAFIFFLNVNDITLDFLDAAERYTKWGCNFFRTQVATYLTMMFNSFLCFILPLICLDLCLPTYSLGTNMRLNMDGYKK